MIIKCNGHIAPDLNMKRIDQNWLSRAFYFLHNFSWLVRRFTRVKSSDVSFKITFVSFQTYIDVLHSV